MKTHWKKIDNPNYLGAYSLMDGSKKEVTMTIDRVSVEEIKNQNGKETAKVVYFKPTKPDLNKPMILNATNSKVIAEVSKSPYIEDWPGSQVTLYVSNEFIFGERMDVLRLKKPVIKTLSDERFKKAIAAIKEGTIEVSTLDNYQLTKAQKDEISKL